MMVKVPMPGCKIMSKEMTPKTAINGPSPREISANFFFLPSSQAAKYKRKVIFTNSAGCKEKPKTLIQLLDAPHSPARPGTKTNSKKSMEVIRTHGQHLRQTR